MQDISTDDDNLSGPQPRGLAIPLRERTRAVQSWLEEQGYPSEIGTPLFSVLLSQGIPDDPAAPWLVELAAAVRESI